MSIDRKAMDAVLRRSCVPILRERGFKGSFPNFFRETGAFVALVTFQFSSAGGSFCVNLGYADPLRSNVYIEPGTKPGKLRISQTQDWVRLGAAAGGDHWFVFGSAGTSPYRGDVLAPEDIAARCNALLRSEAEDWWAKKRGDPCS